MPLTSPRPTRHRPRPTRPRPPSTRRRNRTHLRRRTSPTPLARAAAVPIPPAGGPPPRASSWAPSPPSASRSSLPSSGTGRCPSRTSRTRRPASCTAYSAGSSSCPRWRRSNNSEPSSGASGRSCSWERASPPPSRCATGGRSTVRPPFRRTISPRSPPPTWPRDSSSSTYSVSPPSGSDAAPSDRPDPSPAARPAGHRLRLDLAGSCWPRYDVADPAGGAPVEITVHHDAARPSALLLPLVDLAALGRDRS